MTFLFFTEMTAICLTTFKRSLQGRETLRGVMLKMSTSVHATFECFSGLCMRDEGGDILVYLNLL